MAYWKKFDESFTTASDEIVEMFCEPCQKDKGVTVTADGFCVKCIEYMCSTCLFYHKKYEPTHTQKDKANMPQDFCLDKCLKHKDKLYKFYCKNCDELACPLCKLLCHGQCSSICHIPTLVEQIESSTELANIQSSIGRMVAELSAFQDDIDLKMKESDKLCHQSEESIREHKSKLETDFQLQYQTFLKNLETKHKASMAVYEKERDESLKKHDTEKTQKLKVFDTETAVIVEERKKQRIRLLSNLTEDGNKLNNKLTETRTTLIKDYENEKNEKSALEEKINKAEAHLIRKINKQLKDDQNKLQTHSSIITSYKEKLLEKRQDITTKQNAKQRCQIFVAMKQAELYIQELENNLKAKMEDRDISHDAFDAANEKIDIYSDSKVLFGNLRNKSEIQKHITEVDTIPFRLCSITAVSDSLIVGIQNSIEPTLFLFNIKAKTVISKLCLPNRACDIKSISRDAVAVLLTGEVERSTCIQFVKISEQNQLVMGYEIQCFIPLKCFLVINHRLILYESHSRKMKIVNMSGNFLKEVKLECPDPVTCAVTVDGDTFYALSGETAVFKMNSDGRIIAANKSFCNLSNTMAVDRAGTVYVCQLMNERYGMFNNKRIIRKLFQLSADLKYEHELKTIYRDNVRRSSLTGTSGYSRPIPKENLSLCYCDKEDNLYVGTGNTIDVYKIT